MARIELAPKIALDFERILGHLQSFGVAEATARIQGIIAAIDVLAHSPMIGRPATGKLRELVIGRGVRGYVALYHYDELLDVAFVLAIRHQREAGFSGR